ncbi:alginate lyase family protein [Mucilaginibacter lappiensis]|uniref:alginate lyase family protein n=1 Tax=Mucilaginibacter lappiensis TaxID=354630 RepID=UPI003D1D2856
MKKILLLAGFIISFLNARAQYVSLTDTEINTLKNNIESKDEVKKAFEPYRQTAENAMDEQPDPIETIVSQGVLAGNPAKTASLKALHDGDKVYALTLLYKLYGQKQYLQKAQDYLQAWAKINKPNGDPINESKLDDFITGYDLIRNEVSSDARNEVDAWLTNIYNAELNSPSAKPGKTTGFNNWNSHRIKVMTLTAFTLHNDGFMEPVYKLLEKQIDDDLYADGTSFDFKERDAFHYHTYTLEPLLKTCMAIYRATGKKYFTYESANGSSIQKSVDFLVPFVTGEKTHAEFVNSKVGFDKARAANHEKGYEAGTLFEPVNGISTLSLAAYFNPSYVNAIQQSPVKEKFNWQLALDQVMKPVAINN